MDVIKYIEDTNKEMEFIDQLMKTSAQRGAEVTKLNFKVDELQTLITGIKDVIAKGRSAEATVRIIKSLIEYSEL